MKTISSKIISFLLFQINWTDSFDFPSDDNSVCNRFQDCKPPSECPAVVRDFKEKKIHPTICSFQSRSLSVCCNKTRSVTVTPSPVVNITQCGVSRTRRVFQFKLRARQGDLPITIASTEAPILTVVGGQEAEENSYPWMAAIGSQLPQLAFESNPKYNWFCGGSYLGGNLILTAAHCIPTPGQGLSLDIVRLGAHNLGFSRKEATADDYRIKSVVVHPNYNASGLVPVNDIAIIVLQTEASGVKEKAEVSPICLPAEGDDLAPAGSDVTVAGWGATIEGGVPADMLQEVTVQVTDMDKCRQVYRTLAGVDIGPGILCAGFDEGGKDACQGDSGGGLLVQDPVSGRWTQVGIVSAGIGCARREVPGLYTRLDKYVNWINNVRSEQDHLLKL